MAGMFIGMLFPLFIVIFMIIIIFSTSKGRTKMKIKEEVSQKFERETLDILDTTPEIDEKRREYKTRRLFYRLLSLALFAASIYCFMIHLFFIPFLLIIVFMVLTIIFSKKENSDLFDIVVAKVIKKYNSDLNYIHTQGIDSSIYREAKFESYDRYHSDDYIMGKINNCNFEMAEVHTERQHTDKDGHTTYTTVFHGAFAKVELNNSFDGVLSIVNNRIKLFNRDQYITIDNEAFEKIYDVFTDDKIKALRLLTPDVTTKMIDMYNETGLYCEIKIVGKYLYIRLYTGALFNFNFSNREKEAKQIGYSLAVLDTTFKVMNNFIEEIERFDV